MRTISILAALALAAISAPVYAQQGSLAFTLESTPDAATPGNVIPKLTWATTPAAQSCTASGASTWTGTKAAQGTVTLASLKPPSPIYALRCQWPGESTSRLTWTPPTQNSDGSSLTDLAGYRVLYGPAANNLSQLIQVPNPGVSTFTVESLTAGQWFFAVKAYNTAGAESTQSNTVTKTIAPPFEVTQSVGVKVPNPPTNVEAQ